MDEQDRLSMWNLAVGIFERKKLLDPHSEAACLLGFAALMCDVQRFFEQELPADREPLLKQVQRLLSTDQLDSDFRDYLLKLKEDITLAESAEVPIGPLNSPWQSEQISERTREVPGMLYPDTMRYYKWLGRSEARSGVRFVELGCWMGLATGCLAEGISTCPSEEWPEIHVYDHFVWESWMTLHCAREQQQYADGESFLPEFRANCDRFAPRVIIHQIEIGKSGPPKLESDLPVAVLVIDLDGHFASNRAAWLEFEPHLIPGRSIVVFNQHGNSRAEDLRSFVRSLGRKLAPFHKVLGSAKGFRFLGNAEEG